MRRKLVAGNWKMNGNLSALVELDAISQLAAATPLVEVGVAVPATLIAPAISRTPTLMIGAQDIHPRQSGAHTGCLSAGMVKEAGAQFSIIGHSERRSDQCEVDGDVKAKGQAARAAGLSAILCVGETLIQRDAGEAFSAVTRQLAASMPDHATGDWLSIAYEPIWAIGTGRVAGIDDVEEMHAAIRVQLQQHLGEAAAAVRIIYGGSVNADNAAALFAAANVDGALVGGASLTAAKFTPIILAAARS